MPAYVIANYTVDDAEKYVQYQQAVMPTLMSRNFKVLVAGHDNKVFEGSPNPVTIVMEFPSKEEAEEWYNSPEYQAIVHLRHESTSGGWLTISEQFVMPTS